jgi:hypothetical protein
MMKRETFAIAKIYVPAKRPRDRLIPKGRTDQLLLQDVARRLCGDTSSPRSHRLVKALAIPPLRIIAGEVKCQLSRTAHCFAETVCTHKQALAVLGAE